MNKRNLDEFVRDFNPTKLYCRMIDLGFDVRLSQMMCRNYENNFYRDFRIQTMRLRTKEVYQ